MYVYMYILIIFLSSSLIVRKEGLFYFLLFKFLNFILFIHLFFLILLFIYFLNVILRNLIVRHSLKFFLVYITQCLDMHTTDKCNFVILSISHMADISSKVQRNFYRLLAFFSFFFFVPLKVIKIYRFKRNW